MRHLPLALALLIGLASSTSFGGLITTAAVNTSGGNVSAGGVIDNLTIPGNKQFWVDIRVTDIAGGGSIVDYFNLRLDIVNVSGTAGRLSFASLGSQLLGTANDFRATSDYIFNAQGGSAGRNTNALFFNPISSTSMGITDGLRLFGSPAPPALQTNLNAGSKLLARVVLEANAAMTSSDIYQLQINSSPLVTTSKAASNDSFVASPSFSFDRFGYWDSVGAPFSYGNNPGGVGAAGSITAGVSGSLSGSLTAVPEPSSMALLGLASLGGLGARYRAWRKKRAA